MKDEIEKMYQKPAVLKVMREIHIFNYDFQNEQKRIFRLKSFNFKKLNEKPIPGFSSMIKKETPMFQTSRFKIDNGRILADIEIFDTSDGRFLLSFIEQFGMIFRPIGVINLLGASNEVVAYNINLIVARPKDRDKL